MLPRIEAEERLKAINDGIVASGFADRDHRRDTFETLEQAASIPRQKPVKASPDALAAMGIGLSMPAPAAAEEPLRGHSVAAASPIIQEAAGG